MKVTNTWEKNIIWGGVPSIIAVLQCTQKLLLLSNFRQTILPPPFELLLIFKRKNYFEFLNSHRITGNLSFPGSDTQKNVMLGDVLQAW